MTDPKWSLDVRTADGEPWRERVVEKPSADACRRHATELAKYGGASMAFRIYTPTGGLWQVALRGTGRLRWMNGNLCSRTAQSPSSTPSSRS